MPASLVTISSEEQRAIGQLEQAMADERSARRRRRIAYAVKLPFALLLGFLTVALLGAGGEVVATAILGTGAVAGAVYTRRRLAANVAHTASPSAVGALALAYRSEDAEVRQAGRLGLQRLLPLVREEHRPDISAGGMAALISLLSEDDNRLILGAIHALGEVGDARAIPAVERLAKRESVAVSTGRGPLSLRFGPVSVGEIHRAAEECLIRIRTRVTGELERDRLLRPVVTNRELLLRPAASISADRDSLLHPAERPEGSCQEVNTIQP